MPMYRKFHDEEEDRSQLNSVPPPSRRLGMSRLRSFGNIKKKAKDSLLQVEEKEDTKERQSSCSVRIKKLRSLSTSKHCKASAYLGTELKPPLPTRSDSMQIAHIESHAPRLPPLTLSYSTNHNESLPSSPVARLGGVRLQSIAKSSSRDVPLPPQPAFLGVRTSSAPNMSGVSNCSIFMTGSNSSNISLMTTTSNLTTEVTPMPISSASNAGSLNIQQDMARQVSSLSNSGVRLSLRALGRRFFSQSERATHDIKELHSTNAQPAMMRSSQRDSLNWNMALPSSPNQSIQTPPLSFHSNTPSTSSCTSTASSSPETPSMHCSPTSIGKASINSASTVQMKSAEVVSSPILSFPTYPLTSSNHEGEEDSDFLQAVLSYALADTEMPMPIASVTVQTQKLLTLTEAKKLEGEKRKKHNVMDRSAWGDHTADESDESEDDYGEEGERVDDREERVERIAKSTKLRSQSSPARRNVGLDTAAKRAIYACTIIKFYPKLAVSPHSEIKVPRSINTAKSLRSHYSSYSHTRSIRIGLARSSIIRRVNTESLSVKMERELDWFVLKYLPLFIAPNLLPLHLAQKAAESSREALARPPLIQQGNENGMAKWASRLSFEERCECVVANDKMELPLKELCLQIGQFFNVNKDKPHPMPLQLSQRCQALAALSSAAAKSIRSGSRTPSSPSDDISNSPDKGNRRLAAPWASPTRARRTSSVISRSPSPLQLEIPASSDKLQLIAVADEADEDVPLARLLTRQRSRAVSENKMSEAASDGYFRGVKQQQERELVLKKQRELLLLQEQERILEKARDRRKATEQAAVLSSPTYVAGNALMVSKRRSKAVSEVGMSPSNRFSRSYQSLSQVDPYPPSNKNSQYEFQMQRPTAQSNPSMPNLLIKPSPPTARKERPSRSRVNSQASAPPSAWSPSFKTSPSSSSSTSHRLSALPPMLRATSLHSMPTQYQSMPPPTMIPQHAIPFQQQPLSPYSMMPMTSPPTFNRQSVIMVPSYYLSPLPYHTPNLSSPLSHSAPRYSVNVNAAS